VADETASPSPDESGDGHGLLIAGGVAVVLAGAGLGLYLALRGKGGGTTSSQPPTEPVPGSLLQGTPSGILYIVDVNGTLHLATAQSLAYCEFCTGQAYVEVVADSALQALVAAYPPGDPLPTSGDCPDYPLTCAPAPACTSGGPTASQISVTATASSVVLQWAEPAADVSVDVYRAHMAPGTSTWVDDDRVKQGLENSSGWTDTDVEPGYWYQYACEFVVNDAAAPGGYAGCSSNYVSVQVPPAVATGRLASPRLIAGGQRQAAVGVL